MSASKVGVSPTRRLVSGRSSVSSPPADAGARLRATPFSASASPGAIVALPLVKPGRLGTTGPGPLADAAGADPPPAGA